VNGVVLHGRCHLNASAIIKGLSGPIFKVIILRRKTAIDDIAVKPITQFPVSLAEEATEEQFSASYPNVRTVAIKKVTIRYFFFIFLLLLVLLLSPRSPPSRLQISVNANLLPHSHKNFLIAVDIILTQYARWHHIAPHHTHTHNTPRYRFKVHTIHNSRRCEANAVQKRAFAFKRTVLSVIG
jgi:hypothetical protein